MRPAKPLNDLIELTPYQLKVREIEELERKINKLTEKLLLMKTEISYTPNKSTRRLWMKDILLAVCSHMDFTPAEVTGPRRYKDLVKSRSLYINLCLELTNHELRTLRELVEIETTQQFAIIKGSNKRSLSIGPLRMMKELLCGPIIQK